MHATHWIAAVVLITLAGCGPKPPASAPENTAEAAAGDAEQAPSGEELALATPPFTLEQIRDATPVGRTYRFVSQQGDQKVTVAMRFSAVTAEGATIERSVVDGSGNTVEQDTSQVTWEEIAKHASYPADATVITETTVEVPAGTFDALLYTVTTEQEGGGTVVSRFYFAKSLPGAPVKAEVVVGDQPMFTMELVEHVAGQ